MDLEGDSGSDFVVRPDGTVVGSDDAAGALAAALPYTGRLARRMGELAGVGDLRSMTALGRRRLAVVVTWTPAGEGTYRATVHPAEDRVVPRFTVVGGVDAATAVEHCLGRVSSLDGVEWSTVVTAGARVVAVRGSREHPLTDLDHLAEVGHRMLAILRSLEDQHASGFIRLGFEQGAVVGASLGRHALVVRVGTTSDVELLEMIDEVRAILAQHDLSTVGSQPDRDALGQQPTPPGDAVVAEVSQPALPPLVGARFAGAGERPPRPPRAARASRRRRFGGR